jgi:hypothetical protein
LVTKLQSGATNDLFQAQDASGNALFAVGSTGTLTIGRSSSTNATLIFKNATNANTVTLTSGVTSASYTTILPSAIGTAGQCLTVASVASTTQTLGYATCGGGGGGGTYVSLQATTPGTADTGNFNISGTGIANLLQAANIDTSAAGALGIGNTNATSINIGTNAITHTINIGTGAATQHVYLGTTFGASDLFLQTGSAGFSLSTSGTHTIDSDAQGYIKFKPTTDGDNTFRIQDASGNDIFAVNTGTRNIGLAAPLQTTAPITSYSYMSFMAGSTVNYVTPLGTSIPTKINIENFNPAAFGQVLAMGLPSTALSTTRVITVLDARASTHQPSIALLSPDEAQVFGLSWDGSNTVPLLKSTTSALQFQANSLNLLTLSAVSGTAVASLGVLGTTTSQLQFSNASNSFSSTIQGGVSTASFITVLPTGLGTAGQCLNVSSVAGSTQNLGYNNCLSDTTGVKLQGGTPGVVQTGNFNISGTGIADALQGTTKVLTPLLDTASAGVLNIGTTNATSINLNKNVTVAAGQYISLVGGITSTRPASPTEGMLYYDTTTKSLIVYSNGKWQSYGGNAATKIVGTSASGGVSGAIASQNSDGADFVNASTTSAQTVINNAIAALPAAGGSVYLMEGTYIVDGSINLPSNVTLVGAGQGTVIKLKNAINASVNAISNSDTTNGNNSISIQNLRLDGNKANNSSGTQEAISFVKVGSTSSSTTGASVSNVIIDSFLTDGININFASGNISIVNNQLKNMGNYAINNSGGKVTITSNQFYGNNYAIESGGDSLNIVGNTFINSTKNAIWFNGINSNMTVTGNTFTASGQEAINASNLVRSNISGNQFYDNGGSGANSTINLTNGNQSSITNNVITDTAGTGYAISLSGTTNIYLSNNTYSGTGATSINDTSTTTIYANQLDSNGNLIHRNQGGLTVGKTSASYTLDVQGAVHTSTLPTPSAPSLVKVGATGTQTWGYKVSALDGAGETLASTEATITNGVTPLTGANFVTISWTPVGGAVQYKVYRTTSGGTPATTGLIATVAGNVQTFNDTAIAASGSVPASNTTGAGIFAGVLQGSSLDNSTAASLNIGGTNATSITLGKTSSNIQTTINGTTLFKPTVGNDSATAVQIQKADSTVLFTADTSSMQVVVGTTTNGIILSSAGLQLKGTARNAKVITLTAEYLGAVLDAGTGSNNSGTMTSGIDLTNRMNYYKWTTTQATNQTYDIDIQVPIPSDFDSWNSNPLSVTSYTSNTTNGTVTLETRDTAGAVICNFVSVTPASTTTWTANNSACTLSSGTYTASGYMTLRIRLQSPTSGDVRVGNIVLNYLSKY